MKFVAGENWRNPEKNLPRLRFVHHETHMERPRCDFGITEMVGERLTAWAREPIPHPTLPEKFLGYRQESNPEPLGWQSDVLTTIPKRWSVIISFLFIIKAPTASRCGFVVLSVRMVENPAGVFTTSAGLSPGVLHLFHTDNKKTIAC